MVPEAEHGSAEYGAATVEYVGLVLLAAVLSAAVALAAGAAVPGGALARALAQNLICAVAGECGEADAAEVTALERAYGPGLAATLRRRAPEISFEDDDFASLPVDFRDCRSRSCADTIRNGSIRATQTGLRPTVFTHVVDCRDATSGDLECGGARAGNLYLQYWLYYPDSLTHGLGRLGGYHLDDWESLQVRIGPDGHAYSRASSHHGYNGGSGGIGSIGSDTGWSPRPAWERGAGSLHVASGSHAGTTARPSGEARRIRREDLVLVPAEGLADRSEDEFAISPPWAKEVWRDPESTGT